jgi:predicted ATPase
MHIPGYDSSVALGQSGGFLLWRARRVHDGRRVLLKTPLASPVRTADVDTLDRELGWSRTLRDTDVTPQAFELNRRGELPCLVMDDEGLELLSPAIGTLSMRALLAISVHLARALDSLHERGVMAGALSPAGLLVDRKGEVARIVDLSSVVRTGADGTTPPTPSIVSPYTSPEQTGRLSRAVDERSDLYALGATLYELLVGQPPCTSRDPLELIHFHVARTPLAPSAAVAGVPDALSQIVMRLLAKDPEDRYQSARGLRLDLEQCLRDVGERGVIEPFELGRHDVSTRFVIPHRLYGREAEVGELSRALDAASSGPATLVLVAGYSGVGKTSLIRELYRPIARQRGSFTSGKFDQVVRDIPYGAVAQAFGTLVRQRLTEPEQPLSAWRARLSAALGANGGVLAEVIPEIELVLGPQAPPPQLDPAEAQNRFRAVFQRFVTTVADRDHPLVVFLDDLQWADAATLALLEALLTSAEVRYLLVIGAFRDNEVDAGHPLSLSAERVQSSGAAVHRLPLAPLAESDLLSFLVDTLRGTRADVLPLARLIHEKTAGNPFFVIQFLRALVQDGLVAFDPERGRWTFQIDAIRTAGLTDNVVDLMTRRIRRLSERAQRALTLAASIGNPFAWDTLLTVSHLAPDQVAGGLSEALDVGLIQRVEDPYGATGGSSRRARSVYRFLHDRVQQAAYELIPEDERPPLHLDIGRLLLADCRGEVPDERLFAIVNHLNLGSALLTERSERLDVARLDLAAGRKAKSSTAYGAAAAHMVQGLALVGADAWDDHYELAYALHCEAAECLYLCGHFDRAEPHFRLVLERAATPLDAAQVHALRITLYEHQSRWGDAVASGRAGLSVLGVSFPEEDGEVEQALDREVDAVQRLLEARSIASLIDMPVASSAEVRMLLRILTILWAPAYVSGRPGLARLISATMTRLSMEHGNTEDSAYGYVTHAITVGPMRGDYASAFEWGQLALAVNARFDDTRRRAKIYQQFHAHVNFWRRPFASCLALAREAQRSGFEAGDFVYAGYGAASETWPAFVGSRSLDAFVAAYTPGLAVLEQLKMTDFAASQRVMLNWARALQGATSAADSLSDATFDEAEYATIYAAKAPFFLTFLYAAKLHLSLLHEDWPAAVDAWRHVKRVAVPGTIWPPVADCWGALALASMAREPGGPDWTELEGQRAQLGILAENCAENFKGPWLLLSAEMERVTGRHAEAIALYGDAADLGAAWGDVQLEALAHERRARLLTQATRSEEAQAAAESARRAYAAWGAHTKVRQLEERYRSRAGGAAAAPEAPAWPVAGGGDASASVDMVTALKLARAIASELRLEDLLRTLMAIAMENAGATRSVFLVLRGETLVVEAEGTVDPSLVVVGHAEPVDESGRVPGAIVQYVRRTGQDVVLDHAAADERFGADPYLLARHPRSLLCVPVNRQGRLGGVLYLENDLAAGVFTPERIEMMRIVAAQAAISLENARLYEDMTAEVRRRTDAETRLRAALGEVEALKNRLEAENVYLQEEIQTQHNFSEIVGNSPALREALRKVERVSATESTVLITGETGTGKEIIARAIHNRSARRDRPLVKVNCGAIPAGLVESELFGHVKGAFTGALQKRSGRFELADRGSIFLDEVGELPPDTQVKLLRVLQEHEFEPVGASRPVRVDVRVIAATNRDLEAMVKAGSFRADLFYRLNVFPIPVPALRDRRDDVPLLVAFFLTTLAKRLGKPLEGFTAQSLERLRQYHWPGNVRELQNVVERAAILASGPIVDLQPELLPTVGAPIAMPDALLSLEDLERAHILEVVRSTRWTIEGAKGAASILGLHPNTLRSRMKKLGIARGTHGMS